MNSFSKHSIVFLLAPLAVAMGTGACTAILGGIDSTEATTTTGAGGGGPIATSAASSGAGGQQNGGGGSGCKSDEKICDGKCAPADAAHGCDAAGCAACPHSHGDVHCVAGACEAFQCEPGFKDCNGNDADGCEVDTSTDASNCGDCKNVCPPGMQHCNGGTCSALDCTAPTADCNGMASDGCEVDTSNDAANCKICGHVCGMVEGSGACVSSACQFTCNAGYAHCSNDPADDAAGCNVDTGNDVNNCGACGHTCAVADGTGSASCANGACQFACTAPFANCGSGHDGNGCNVDTSEAQNCGGCGVACASLPGTDGTCSSQKCQCKTGYYDYDGQPGCEAAYPTAVPEASSLKLWLKGDYGYVAGGTWRDQSGNGNDATLLYGGAPATASFNGRQVVSFQGSELLISNGFPNWSGATVFAVQNATATNALISFGVSFNPGCSTTPPGGAPNCQPYDMLAFGGFGAIGLEMCDGNIGTCFQAYDAQPSGWLRSVGVLIPNQTPSYRIFWNGNETLPVGHSGQWPFPAPWASPRKDAVVAWNGYRGQVAEIIVFTSAISDASRQAIDAYLANKWGI